jgi:hypothetical protein
MGERGLSVSDFSDGKILKLAEKFAEKKMHAEYKVAQALRLRDE